MENKSKNNDKIDYLLKQEPFSIDISEKHDLFCDAMQQSFLYHYNNNQLFKNLCDNQNFKVSNRVDDLSKYPFIPVTIFKEKNFFTKYLDIFESPPTMRVFFFILNYDLNIIQNR